MVLDELGLAAERQVRGEYQERDGKTSPTARAWTCLDVYQLPYVLLDVDLTVTWGFLLLAGCTFDGVLVPTGFMRLQHPEKQPLDAFTPN